MKEKGIEAEYKKYESSPDSLHSDLSRMFTNEIQGYTIPESLESSIIPLLDWVENTKRINTVVNANGVLKGYYLESSNIEELVEKQIDLWL